MELQFHILTILVLLITIMPSVITIVEPELMLNIPDIKPARALDIALQNYAYRSLDNPKTGVVYDGIVPRNLTGIRIAALRLRSGSLFTRGVRMYKEFRIPIGVVVQPYVERLVFVYQDLGNRSSVYYSLPGYMYLAPVLGLIAYNCSDTMIKNSTELDVHASGDPIVIDFGSVRTAPDGLDPRCVWVDLHGRVNFTNVVAGNRCLAFKQGHFSIVVRLKSVPPATSDVVKNKHGGIDSRVWAIVLYVGGGCLLWVLLALLVVLICRYKRRKKTRKMERVAEGGEPLHMTMVGGMKVPAAMVTRTQPTLETEYVP